MPRTHTLTLLWCAAFEEIVWNFIITWILYNTHNEHYLFKSWPKIARKNWSVRQHSFVAGYLIGACDDSDVTYVNNIIASVSLWRHWRKQMKLSAVAGDSRNQFLTL